MAAHSSAPPPIAIPAWEKFTAAAVYVAMYLILIAQPIVGWLMSTAYGFPVVYLGVLHLPAPVAEDRALAERLDQVHVTLAVTLALLFAAHLGGIITSSVGTRSSTGCFHPSRRHQSITHDPPAVETLQHQTAVQ
jgi:cytochrome b561